MKTRFMIGLSILLVALLTMSGCGSMSARDLMVNVQAAEKPASPTEPDLDFTDSISEFTWSLFHETVKTKGNVLISPASVYLVLAMTMNGAAGTTRDAILRTLAAEKLSVEKINIACRDWMTLLMNTTSKTELLISDSIWYNIGFSADQAFLKVNADYYAAAMRQMDFSKAEAAQVINDWVNQATRGKIKSIMNKTNAEDAMYLINAVYFKSQWKNQFASLKTHSGDFYLENGTTTASYMNRQSETDYLSGDGMEGVLLPFTDKRFAFIALLPEKGRTIQDTVSGMDSATFKRLLASSQPIMLNLHLPKFETEFEINMMESLANLGLGEACRAGADFSLMDKKRNKGLSISGIGHKTYFKIDETGVEAAAVTGLTMAASLQPAEGKKLIFDRSFLYGIIDTISGVPLFLGIMDNPAN
jgi:serine protease inhibitor